MKNKYIIYLIILIFIIISNIYIINHTKQYFSKDDTVMLTENAVNDTKEKMPKIVDIIIGNNYYIALCEDGSVWSWNEDEPNKILNLNGIIKIMDVNSAFYALSKDGYVYAWGKNNGLLISTEKNREEIFTEPIKLTELSDIVYMDAKNGKAFAIDQYDNFYMWGLYLYWEELNDMIPGFPKNNIMLAKDVKSLFVGSGNYHYFIRQNGTVFSIMESQFEAFQSPYDFIFPELSIRNNEIYDQSEKDMISLNKFNSSIILNEGTKLGLTILYELGIGDDIKRIDADEYTMFLYKNDNTLWFWNSNRIKYHDNKRVLADPETALVDYSGNFVEVNFKEILGMKTSDNNDKIIDICSGKENTLFLTDSGQVFISEYITYAVEDIEYYNTANTNPDRSVFTSIEPDMHLKKISFRKLDLENITSVNSDGKYHFSAVDAAGNYYHSDMTP